MIHLEYIPQNTKGEDALMHARPRYLAPHINARLAQGTASTHCRSVFSTHDMVQRYGTEVWYRGMVQRYGTEVWYRGMVPRYKYSSLCLHLAPDTAPKGPLSREPRRGHSRANTSPCRAAAALELRSRHRRHAWKLAAVGRCGPGGGGGQAQLPPGRLAA